MRILICFIILLLALPAYAIRITNLDTAPHDLAVKNGGEIKIVTLAPNETYATYGPSVYLQVKGHKAKYADPFNDYTIWKGGELTVQNHHQPGINK